MANTATYNSIVDFNKIRNDFPLLNRKINGQQLNYLDNGATAQKPKVVIDAVHNYYTSQNSNIHRGVHHLSQEATGAYEEARDLTREFFNIAEREEVIFTSGTTDGINLVASTFGRQNIHEGDEIILSEMEHHSNIVPWQMLCQEKKATLKVIPINDDGELDMDTFYKLLNSKTKLIAVSHVSNVLGTVNPIAEIIKASHEINVPVLIDGAQAVPHMRVDMQHLDCDFYVFSAHKMFGPTGIGVLYGKRALLEEMKPYRGGGEMIKDVSFQETTYNELPYKFEAGTPNIAGGIGMSAALKYMDQLDFQKIHEHENLLLQRTMHGLKDIEGLRFIGKAKDKSSLVAFVVEGVHHYDIGMILDQMGIAVRTGHNCAQPLMARFGITGTVRASFAMYNTVEEVDQLIVGVKKAIKMLKR